VSRIACGGTHLVDPVTINCWCLARSGSHPIHEIEGNRICFTKSPFELVSSYRGSLRVPLRRKARAVLPICRSRLHRLLVCKDYGARNHADEKRTGQDEHHQANRMRSRLKPQSVGPRVPGLGVSYTPRPSLSACKNSMTPPFVPPFRE
jgi:hypothetical protein